MDPTSHVWQMFQAVLHIAVFRVQDGLVHISAIAPGRVEKVSDYLDVGDKVWAKALSFSVDAEDTEIPWPMVRTCATYIPSS